MKNKKIVITGGAGFIGSQLVIRLVETGNRVIVLDSLIRGNKIPKEFLDQIELVVADVCDKDAVEKAVRGCDLIFHFAAILGVDIVADNPVETMEVEFLGAKNVADAAIKYNVEKVVYASTSGVYGKRDMEHAATEDGASSPTTSYAIAKRFNEVYLKSLFEEKGLESVAIRYFNVYGLRQDARMVIPRFFKQAIHGVDITVYGNGKQTRDFTFVDEAVEATILLAEKSKGAEIYNVAREEEFSIASLAERINQLCGGKSNVRLVDLPGGRYDFEVDKRVGNSDKLFRKTGFKPTLTIDKGLTLVAPHYNEFFAQKGL
jgi:UDP-glucose 4-epimerase